jgi:multidrug transporter EmrE-like cation transporter
MSTPIKVNGKMNITVAYILVAVAGSAAGQLLLKRGMSTMGPLTISANQIFKTMWRIGTNPYVCIGLFVYLCGTFLWLVALSRVDLSYAYPFASLSYIVIIIGAWLFFGERIDMWRILGSLAIITGVIFISRSGR